VFFINNNLFSQEDENWTQIDSYDNYDNLEGYWEGTAISVIKGNILNTEFKSNLNISLLFNYKKGDKFVSSGVKIDFNNMLTDLEKLKEFKERGYTKESMWEILKSELKKGNFKFDRYSILIENTESADEYFASDSKGQFLINKDKDTLLLIYHEPSFILGIGDSGFTRMIFKKPIK
jgi:hypothetical protein